MRTNQRPAPAHASGILDRFARRTDGATAVETIFILPIFFAMVFSTIEVGWVFFRTAMVEQAIADSGRKVLTGQAPPSQKVQQDEEGNPLDLLDEDEGRDLGRDEFFWDLCERVQFFGDCLERLSVEVLAFPTMEALLEDQSVITCPNEPGFKFNQMPYDPGSRNSYTIVRACFVVDVYTPGIGIDLRSNPDGTKSLIAIQVRRNEPYKS